MLCPKCNQTSIVCDTRKRRECIQRTRRCAHCDHRFTTTERYDSDALARQLRDVVRAIDEAAGAIEQVIKAERGRQ